jgi:hypothetical protein
MSYILIFSFWVLTAFSGWRIFSRAGFEGIMGLLFLVPIGNLIALLYLAHQEWPIDRIKNKEIESTENNHH